MLGESISIRKKQILQSILLTNHERNASLLFSTRFRRIYELMHVTGFEPVMFY